MFSVPHASFRSEFSFRATNTRTTTTEVRASEQSENHRAPTPASMTPPTPEAAGFVSRPSQGISSHRPSLPAGPEHSRTGSTRAASNEPAPAGRAPASPPMSLSAARALLDSKGMGFVTPPFLDEEPPMPKQLTELPRIPASIEDIPATSPALKEMYQTYANKKAAWSQQKKNFQALADKYTMTLATMIARHPSLRLNDVKTWLRFDGALELELKAILLNRYPGKETLTHLDLDHAINYLAKKEKLQSPVQYAPSTIPFRPLGRHTPHWLSFNIHSPVTLRSVYTVHPKDAKALTSLLKQKKNFEAELAQYLKNPGATLDYMRDRNAKFQSQLETSADKALANKKNRYERHQYQVRNASFFVAGGASGLGIYHMLFAGGGSGDDKDHKGAKT
ncbi:MAG TPA: hypothetical protein VME63_11875 [Dyella sp.]|uniref:hypothetical protein n=1 Tax=Dyella sp. TaxID=1869338 RepID=UPI002C16E7F9|nr:hypothetical protein [Dyella sp.]HTV86101.1 hypothetical protein [Dyella sp.]